MSQCDRGLADRISLAHRNGMAGVRGRDTSAETALIVIELSPKSVLLRRIVLS